MFLFQRLSVALQTGHAVAFLAIFVNSLSVIASVVHFAYNILACKLAQKIIIAFMVMLLTR